MVSVFADQLISIASDLAHLEELLEAKLLERQRLVELEETFIQVRTGITGILAAAAGLGEDQEPHI